MWWVPLVAAAIAAGTTIWSVNEQNKNAQKQMDFEVKMQNDTWFHNSPKNQKKELEEAGFNPYQYFNGFVPATNTVHFPSIATPDFSQAIGYLMDIPETVREEQLLGMKQEELAYVLTDKFMLTQAQLDKMAADLSAKAENGELQKSVVDEYLTKFFGTGTANDIESGLGEVWQVVKAVAYAWTLKQLGLKPGGKFSPKVKTKIKQNPKITR